MKSTNSEFERQYSRKNLSEIFKNKMLKEERKTNDFKRVHNRSTNPLYNDHIARYYQRIRKGFKKWIFDHPISFKTNIKTNN